MSETTMTVVNAQGPAGVRLVTVDDFTRFGRQVSESAFAPTAFRGKPTDCTMAIILGSEIGLTAVQAIQSIAVINGKPSVYGDTMLGLCRRSPLCVSVEEWIEGDGDSRTAVCEVVRRGEKPHRSTFSVADAKRAKLWSKPGPWQEYPDRMLRMRARGFALRDKFPDLLRGLISSEEAADYPHPVETRREPVVVRPRFSTPATKTVDPDDDFESFKKDGPVLVMDEEPVIVPVREPAPVDPFATAKGQIEKATTLDRLHELRSRVDERLADGTFKADAALELAQAIHAKAEVLIKAEEITQD